MIHFIVEPNQVLTKDFRGFSRNVSVIYRQAIDDYHKNDSIDQPVSNPYQEGKLDHLLFMKCWIDTVQWHVEDEVRKPDIGSTEALMLKRRIDQLNQQRTDLVETIDGYFLARFKDVVASPAARVNTESPAWALDRLSILALKIYHMDLETKREDANEAHIQRCRLKATVLDEQQEYLSLSIDELLQDISEGKKYMKVYKQMKMYNDPSLNPVLYKSAAFRK